MLTALSAIFASKKFWLAVIGSGVTGGLTYLHAPTPLIVAVAGLFGSNVLGQGLSDLGKNSK